MQPSQTTCRHCGLAYHSGKKCSEARAEAEAARAEVGTARLEAAACQGKVPHETQFAASSAIRRMASSRNRDRKVGRVQIYQCTHCGYWHIGGGAR